MSQTIRDAQRWKEDIKIRSEVLYRKINEIKPLYGMAPATPEKNEITQAFALCLNDIGRYCDENRINAKNIDTVKLMAFSVPYLLSIRSYALQVDMYIHACLLVIHGNDKPMYDFTEIMKTTNVSKHLCLKYPSQHMIVYGYLKGYQESLEINS